MRVLAIVLLVAVLAAATSSAEVRHQRAAAADTTLYFHLIDGNNDFPINTQVPSDKWSIAPGRGLATHSTSCLPPVDGSPLTSKEWHTWYGYSSPSEVQYDVEENGLPRVHPERGFSFDVRLDTSRQPVLYWYLETQAGAGPADAAPVVLPNVVVAATMRTGSAIGIGDELYNQGEVLAQGRTDPSTLAGELTVGPAEHLGGEPPVYRFTIPLDLQTDTFPSKTGFNVRIDAWVDNPACAGGDGGYLMPNNVRLHTSPANRPRMELTVANPLEIGVLHPQIVGDDFVVHIEANSPWGSYDVDERGGLDLSVLGPSQPSELQVRLTTHIHDHGPEAHFQPLGVAAIWPEALREAEPGIYKIRFTAWNDQHTAQAVAETEFEIGGAQPPDTRTVPALGPALGIILLLGYALCRR